MYLQVRLSVLHFQDEFPSGIAKVHGIVSCTFTIFINIKLALKNCATQWSIWKSERKMRRKAPRLLLLTAVDIIKQYTSERSRNTKRKGRIWRSFIDEDCSSKQQKYISSSIRSSNASRINQQIGFSEAPGIDEQCHLRQPCESVLQSPRTHAMDTWLEKFNGSVTCVGTCGRLRARSRNC